MPSVKCCRSHAPFICYVVMRASNDELEAPITAFSGGKEGDVASSPSPLGNNQRSANRYFVCRQESAPFGSPLHIPSCNESFQRRAGSINRSALSCKRGRRCLVVLSACESLKIGEQVSVCRRCSAAIRMPYAFAML